MVFTIDSVASPVRLIDMAALVRDNRAGNRRGAKEQHGCKEQRRRERLGRARWAGRKPQQAVRRGPASSLSSAERGCGTIGTDDRVRADSKNLHDGKLR